MLLFLCALAALVLAATDITSQALARVCGMHTEELRIPSSADGTLQPVVVGVPEGYDAAAGAPLLVGIHTWSATCLQLVAAFGSLAVQRGWLMVLPHFRGPNLATNPCARDAGGSLLAQCDIIDAVKYMCGRFTVDSERIYMVGGSGGGHMSLLTAAKYPHIWAGVSVWCPITHLQEWHEAQNSYAPHIEAVCGGSPGKNPETDFEYVRRSPRTFITNLAAVPVQIAHGDKDPIVSVEQTWRTYLMLRNIAHRAHFKSWTGGHQLENETAMDWLAGQVRPADVPMRLDITSDEPRWYYWLYVEPARPLCLGVVTAEVQVAPGHDDASAGSTADLVLSVKQCCCVRVKLSMFGRESGVAVVTEDGRPAGQALWRQEGDELVLHPPSSEPIVYEVRFGG